MNDDNFDYPNGCWAVALDLPVMKKLVPKKRRKANRTTRAKLRAAALIRNAREK